MANNLDLAKLRRLAEAARDADAAWKASGYVTSSSDTEWTGLYLARAMRWPTALVLIARVETLESANIAICRVAESMLKESTAERDAALARVEALEAALRECAASAPDATTLGVPDVDYWCNVAQRRQNIARAALKEVM